MAAAQVALPTAAGVRGLFVSQYQPSPQDYDEADRLSKPEEFKRRDRWRIVTQLFHVIFTGKFKWIEFESALWKVGLETVRQLERQQGLWSRSLPPCALIRWANRLESVRSMANSSSVPS
jgi:hypothetical protein